jgi:hypothetical protein
MNQHALTVELQVETYRKTDVTGRPIELWDQVGILKAADTLQSFLEQSPKSARQMSSYPIAR